MLGCTHYPLLRDVIERTVAWNVIDSAVATALEVSTRLKELGIASTGSGPATSRFFATDSVDKFRRLGGAFLGQTIEEVHLVDLGG